MKRYKKIIKLLLQVSLLKTILVNIKSCGLHFLHFPIIVFKNTVIKSYKGDIIFNCPVQLGVLQIGRECLGFQDHNKKTIWNNCGKVILNGKCSLGKGCRIDVAKCGVLTIGDKFNASGEMTIVCHKSITFGNGDLISWNTFFMDTDFHYIYNIQSGGVLSIILNLSLLVTMYG